MDAFLLGSGPVWSLVFLPSTTLAMTTHQPLDSLTLARMDPLQTSFTDLLLDTFPASSQSSALLPPLDTLSPMLECTESVSLPLECLVPSQLPSLLMDMDQ